MHHQAKDEEEKMNRLTDCVFYQKNCCTKGVNCAFRHANVKSEFVCKFWLKGRCADVDCIYRHPTIKAKSSTPCHFFQTGQCTKGASCPFIHESVTAKPEVIVQASKEKAKDAAISSHEPSADKESPIPRKRSQNELTSIDNGGGSITASSILNNVPKNLKDNSPKEDKPEPKRRKLERSLEHVPKENSEPAQQQAVPKTLERPGNAPVQKSVLQNPATQKPIQQKPAPQKPTPQNSSPQKPIQQKPAPQNSVAPKETPKPVKYDPSSDDAELAELEKLLAA